MSIVYDLRGEYEISRVVQLHGQWSDDYPGEFKVEVSRRSDDRDFREVWRGRGSPDRSVATFSPTSARFVMITALRSRDRYHWWSIAELRTNRDDDQNGADDDDRLADREIKRVFARGLSDPEAVIGRDTSTRATTRRGDYAGSWIQIELDRMYTISRVVQVHTPNDRDCPGRYRVEVSLDGRRWQSVWEGPGAIGRSAADFAEVRARFVRITALDTRDRRSWWSISRVRIRG
jgi:hypothetical protein